MSLRRRDALERRTIFDNDNGAFLTTQFWYERDIDIIWWDLDLLFQSVRHFCKRRQKKCHWLLVFKQRIAKDLDQFEPQVVLARIKEVPLLLNANMCSSRALFTYCIISIEKSKDVLDSELFVTSIVNLLPRVLGAIIDSSIEGTFEVGGRQLQIDRLGQVAHFNNCLHQLHKTCLALLRRDP